MKITVLRSRVLMLMLLVGVLALVTVGCDRRPGVVPPADGPCAGQGFEAHRNLQYDDVPGTPDRLLSLDLYEPKLAADCGPAPIVVFVHGGGFRRGDKLHKVRDKVPYFTGQGYVFASVNYRLTTPTNGVQYPTHQQDVAAAIAWLSDNAAEYGGDPQRILLIGHSAGAALVSLLSTDTSFLTAAGVEPTDVRCTVSLDTQYDVAEQATNSGPMGEIFGNAFGDDPETWRVGSPISHTAPGEYRPDFLIVVQGSDRRIASSEDFAARLRAGGTPAEVLDGSPLDHAGVNAAVGQRRDRIVTPAITEFFDACVAPAA